MAPYSAARNVKNLCGFLIEQEPTTAELSRREQDKSALRSLEHPESNVNARMAQVIQVIGATIVHDITGVSVVPA